MKNYSFNLIMVLVMCVNLNFAQKNKNELNRLYKEYFHLERETIYLHLNKTTFVSGEKIWFSAYVFDTKNGKPYTKTTNLICKIYDHEGTQLDEKLFYVDNGFAIGQLDIPSQLTSEEFYVKASTNWMKNFEDEGAFIQKLSYIKDITKHIQEKIETDKYQVQLFPEGGHLVENTLNTVGFIATDINGKGVPIKNAQLVSDNNNIILEKIESDYQGIGKFRTYINSNHNYSLEVVFADNSKIVASLPKPQNEGISLSLNSILEEKIIVVIGTNNITLEKLKDQQLYVAIHRDGLLSLSAFKLESTEKTFTIGAEGLFPGINILTLFDQNLKPISERLFFNNNSLNIGELAPITTSPNILNDSIKIKLNLYSKNSSPTNLSLSILPNETRANNNHKSIFSSFLFDSYLKNEIINADYYIKNTSRKKRYELDNLLITKGWSKYNWEKIFGYTKQEEKFEFQKGITISGTVKNANKNRYKMVMNDSLNQYQYFTEIDSLKNFKIFDAIFFKDSDIEARLFNLDGEIFKPKLTISSAVPFIKDSLPIDIPNNIFSSSKIKNQVYDNYNGSYNGRLSNLISLDNITVSTPKIKNKYIAISNSLMTTVFPEAEKGLISGFIIKLGFISSIVNPYDGLIDGKKYVISGQGGSVPVLIDGFFEEGFYDKRIEEVFSVVYQRPYGPIIINSKKPKPIELVAKHLLKEGFERPEIYYNPYYKIELKEYLEYGSVFWEGQLKIEKNGIHEFMIPNTGLKNLKLFIEGMSEDGTLFSDVQSVYLK